MGDFGRMLVVVLGALWFSGCASSGAPVPANEATHRVEVFNNGWHTSIVLPRTLLPPGMIPETEDFPDAQYFKIGWGDRDYYPAGKAGIATTVAAILWPTSAVIHVVGLHRSVSETFVGSEVLAIGLTAEMFDRLVTHITASFDREGQRRAAVYEAGLYHESLFYKAHGRFHLFSTCNTWTVRAFSEAGLPVSPATTITAGKAMRQLGQFAHGPP